MSVQDALLERQQELAESYEANILNARNLQRTLEEDILPGLVDELGLDGLGEQRARQWLNDIHSVFRLLRRHKFTISFALENARDVLLWRLAVIPDDIPRALDPPLNCLPSNALDPFGRPIIVVKLARLLDPAEDVRPVLINYLELLRLNLEDVNKHANADSTPRQPILQYVALVDIGGMSVQNVQNVDLLAWFIYEILPRFPGMLAAVFILNYSWAHSGVWNIVKRALPKSALSRVFFPSQAELLEYFPPSSLPREYGGSLPPLPDLEDPLEKFTKTLPAHANPTSSDVLPTSSAEVQPSSSSATLKPISRVPSISPTSHLNPYFGYPVSGRGAPTPRLRHGRQRKRDLVRTLAALWWSKWKHRLILFLCVLLAVLSYRRRHSPRMLKWRQSLRRLLRPPGRS